ncbi:MAG: hypothetical protein CL916_00450 [Deltaproteobacteria bacterium]|nr:hypothetical protein [Deltaproteobacteria bacterium]
MLGLWTVLGTACSVEAPIDAVAKAPVLIGEVSNNQGTIDPSSWPMGFPAVQDLALMFQGKEPILSAGDMTSKGDVFLPYRWVQAVSDSYLNTEVGEALEWENIYEDWRLVSMRIVPCAPLGVAVTQDPQELCWPMVRLVWQPVLLDHYVGWTTFSEYADDRAIHALYPLEARDAQGNIVDAPMKNAIADHLREGGLADSIPDDVVEEFSKQRDQTASWLLSKTLSLRSELSARSWDEYDIRSEWIFDETASVFQGRLRSFLSEVAHPDQLRELTSFSLPEGREPAHLDIWVFLAFSGLDGNITPVDLEVFDRETGRLLMNMGKTQTVSMASEDELIVESIEQGNEALAEQVVTSPDDPTIDVLSNPNEFLVPNTSCASCHKLNDLRFDLHNLSSLEDRAITVSPRVKQDVLADQLWTMGLRERK